MRTDMGGGRGIGLYCETTDMDGNHVKVSESSLATEIALRIYTGSECAHLSAEQAIRVRDAINDWLEYQFGSALDKVAP